jgi:hypothetical protein
MKASTSPSMDRDWEAEEDARAMTRMAEITGDSKRRSRAEKALKEQERKAKDALLHVKAARGLKKVFG